LLNRCQKQRKVTTVKRRRNKKQRWLFWDQSPKKEKAEIRKAQAAGLELQYMQGQVWKRMVEAELQRRRDRKAA
jgi:hypothetical protein